MAEGLKVDSLAIAVSLNGRLMTRLFQSNAKIGGHLSQDTTREKRETKSESSDNQCKETAIIRISESLPEFVELWIHRSKR